MAHRPVHEISILFPRAQDRQSTGRRPTPDSLRDLNLDQVVAAVTRGRAEYDLDEYFLSPLRDASAVRYRQEVFRDLESATPRRAIIAFSASMRRARTLLNRKLDHRYQRETWFLEAAEVYSRCVVELHHVLAAAEPRSSGLSAFADYLAAYVEADDFRSLASDVAQVREGLAGVEYNLRIRPGRVTVSMPDPAPDYAAAIETAFERFRRGAVRDYLATFTTEPDLNHPAILERIARLYPAAFGALDAFCSRHADLMDPTIAAFDRDVQFYLGYLDLMDRLRADGLPFCSPRVAAGGKAVSVKGMFDIALASRRSGQGAPIVVNDVTLDGPERVIVVTGPNQGGKTTFARAFGQVLYLAGLGCPVAGSDAEVPLVDRVFTHFGREEQLADERSRLEEELHRMRAILDGATSQSALILNEVLASTTLVDAVYLSTELLRRIEELDLVGLWVTFVDELASMSASTVSMVGGVLADDPTVRTFKITRRPAEGHAYAAAIATKYGVSYARLKARLPA